MVYHKLASSKGQIEDTPHANICSIYLTAKCLPLPFSSIDEISHSLGKREIQLKTLYDKAAMIRVCFLWLTKNRQFFSPQLKTVVELQTSNPLNCVVQDAIIMRTKV